MPRIIPGEILLDTLNRRGRRGLEESDFELLTVGAVVDPLPEAVIHSPAEIAAAWPRRAARYVDCILKGEKPADLPVQAPTSLMRSSPASAAADRNGRLWRNRIARCQ